MPQEFTPGRFQEVQIAAVVDVVAHRALRVGHAVAVAKDLRFRHTSNYRPVTVPVESPNALPAALSASRRTQSITANPKTNAPPA